MALLRSTGIPIFDSIPTDAPTTHGPVFGQLVNSNTFYYYNGASWVTVIIGDDTAYNATSWNGNLSVPTKNAIRDKIEALSLSGVPDGDYGDIVVSGAGTVYTLDTGINATKLADGTVSNTEFQYINSLTSNVQTQLNTKAVDTEVIHDTGNESVAGVKTFTNGIQTLDEAYNAGTWNGNNEVPTKNAIRDKIETLSTDTAVVHIAGTENITGAKTFTLDVVVPAETYGVGWNSSNEVPTKNDVYDKIETISSTLASKVFKALISQSGTGTPTATIIYNTLGEVPTFVRNSQGDYEVNTVANIFSTTKTIVHATISPGSTGFQVRAGFGVSLNEVAFKVYDAANSIVDLVGSINMTIEIFP